MNSDINDSINSGINSDINDSINSGINSIVHKKLPELGLVCITASQEIRFRTITRKRLLQRSIDDQKQTLRDIYTENLKRLATAIDYCNHLNIHLYRLSSALMPFADEPIGAATMMEFPEVMAAIGQRAKELGVRIVLHPEQFVVLNSDRPEVIENSIKVLTAYAQIFDLLGLPRSPWALMNIHGGKGDRAERLVEVIQRLPDTVRLRLTLENDEYTYSATEILAICRAAGIPMVFDAHHHIIHEKLASYDDPSVAAMVLAARTTWPHPDWQLVHISNGSASFGDPRHSDYIYDMPASYQDVPWIEIEAKQKELAIVRLQQEWLTLLNGK